jgi:hypothetical protein
VPHVPDDPDARDDALDHVVKNLFDVELEQLAFGRPRDEDEQRRAAAAARELARRAAEYSSRMGEPARSAIEVDTVAEAPIDSSSRARPLSVQDRDVRPWWTRTAALVAAGILVVIVATSIGPLLPTNPGTAPSLDVFEREASVEERDLGAQLLRDGLRVSFAPRIIAEEEDAQFVAYRVIVTSTVERSRSEICVLLADELGFGWPSCADRAEVERDGIRSTLSGQSARYILQWGPVGPPRVSVLPDVGAAPGNPESAAAQPFFTEPPGQDETAYSGLLRVVHPDDRLIVRILDSTEGWEAVGALVASADTERWSYCVHLFQRAEDRRAQLGASVTCAGREAFEQDGVVAQARGVDSTVRLEWRPDGAVHMSELALAPDGP